MPRMNMAPLEDPAYTPAHQPISGRIPDVIAKWGPRSQLRWVHRFRHQLAQGQDVTHLYADSLHHTGWCCSACIGEYEDGYQGGGVMVDGWCCCRDRRIKER